MPLVRTHGFTWLAWTGMLLGTGCTIEVSPDGGGSSNTTPPTVITVRIVNATGKALDPQIYVGPASAGAAALFTDANKKRDFGFGGLGYVETDAEASFTLACGQHVLIGTQGGAFGDNLNTPLGQGQSFIFEEDVNIRCTYLLTFTFSSNGGQLVTEYSVAPWEP